MAPTDILITLDGADIASATRWGSCRIADVLNAAPNTATLAFDTRPSVGQDVRIGLGSLATADLLFGGTIQDIGESYEDLYRNMIWPATCIDYTFLLNRRRPFGTWTLTSATTIAQSLVTNYASGFTSAGVASSLAAVSIIFDGSEDFMTCLGRLATAIGGYCYVDYGKDVHLFLTEVTSPPNPINSAHPPLNRPPITFTTDISQLRTLVYGKGHAETVPMDVSAGATTVPLVDAVMFNASGGQALAGTTPAGAQSQILTYTGVGVISDLNAWAFGAMPTATVDVIWASTLGLFAAVDVGGGLIVTSPDGITWTNRATAATGLTSVTWSASLGLLVAVGGNGSVAAVMTSPDGITWTSRTAAEANAWTCVAWAPSLSLFVAVASTGTHRVMTSPDGTTWTARTAAEANSWERVVWAPSLALFAAVAADGTNRVMTSPDGITWTSRTAAAASNWYGLAWAPSLALFAAVSQGGLAMTSPDGITWTSRTPSAANGWTAVAWAPELGLFLAVAFSGTGRVMTSTDGILWLDRSVTIDKSWRGVTWSATLGTFVVVSDQASAMRNATVPALTGVTGLALAMQKGTPVAIWVKRNDTAAQTALALFEGGDGIREYLIVDQRRGEASLTAVCDADLAKFSRPLTSVTYATNDPLTRSGKTVSISLAIGTWDVMFDPAVFGDVIWGESGDFTIQDVTITFDAPGAYPRYTVTAASVNFTLADLLARLALAA